MKLSFVLKSLIKYMAILNLIKLSKVKNITLYIVLTKFKYFLLKKEKSVRRKVFASSSRTGIILLFILNNLYKHKA